MSDVAAIILAAGLGTRFAAGNARTTKLLAELDGKPLVRHVADAALASRARPVIIVTGHARERMENALGGLPLTFVHNADYASGLASSLRTGIAAVPATAAAAIVLLGDMPLVTGALVDALIRAFEAHPSTDAVVPLLAGRRGNPVVLARSMFAEASRLTGDQGARGLLTEPRRRIIELPLAGEAASTDIDTPEELALLAGRAAGAAGGAATT